MDPVNAKQLNVLVVEDDAIDTKVMQRLLSESPLPIGDVVCVNRLDRALAVLAGRTFDVLVLDLNLPDSSGLQTLMAVERSHSPVPKIVVTGVGDESLGLRAVATGAQDYLVKGQFDSDSLSRVIRYSVERKKSQAALIQARDRLNAMLESISDPMIMVDRELRIIWSNEAHQQVFGDDLIGTKCHQAGHGLDRPCESRPCIVMETFQDGQPHSRDIEMVGRDGTTRYFRCTANVALRGKDGHPVAALEIARDITDSRTAEIVKAAYRRVEKANRQLRETQSQLVQSEKLASIGQLAAGVAHEMNTPIGFVACNFETLEGHMKTVGSLLGLYGRLERHVEAAGDADGLATLRRIRECKQQVGFDETVADLQILFDDSREGLEQVTRIIQTLRDFSRIDQAGDVFEYDINEGIRTTLTVARNTIKYDVDVKTELGDIPAVCCNSGQINQVLLNIIINATQAITSQSRQGKGHITVRTYRADAYVVCEIADDGPGIRPEHLRRVFDPFFTTKPVGTGTGLGLSVSHDIIVNKHGGRISVESEPGRGTLFSIKIPIEGPGSADNNSEETLIGATTDE